MPQSLKNICLVLMIMLYLTGCQSTGDVAVKIPGNQSSHPSSKHKKMVLRPMHQPTVTVTNTMTDINLNMIQKSGHILSSTFVIHTLRIICIYVCRLTVDGWHLQPLRVDGGWHSPVKYRLKCVILNTKANIKANIKSISMTDTAG